jgi:hypothetical protein
LVFFIGFFDGLAPACFVAGEVFVGDETASRLHLGNQQVGGFTGVKTFCAQITNSGQGSS